MTKKQSLEKAAARGLPQAVRTACRRLEKAHDRYEAAVELYGFAAMDECVEADAAVAAAHKKYLAVLGAWKAATAKAESEARS